MIDKANPLISIIIPVYNVKPYLEEALESVVHQTHENLEIIVVDDGSSDGSGAICDEFATKDSRITVIHQDNGGLSSARNAGLDMMHGEYVAFLDPDDAYHPDYAKRLLTAALRDSVDIAVCRYTPQKTEKKLRYDAVSSKEPSLEAGIYNRTRSLQALAESRLNISVWNKLYHRRLWTTIRFPDGQVYEDVDTTFRILDICSSISVLDDPLYIKRTRSGSITDTLTQKYCSDWLLSFSDYVDYIKENTPRMFSYGQLRTVQRSVVNGMMVMYVQSSRKNYEMDRTYLEQFRMKIIKKGEEEDIKRFSLRTRVGYQLLRLTPGVLHIIYPVYRPLRMLIHICTSRVAERKAAWRKCIHR